MVQLNVVLTVKHLRWTVTCTTRRTHRSRHHFSPRLQSFHLCCSTTLLLPTQRRTGMSPLLPWTWTSSGRHHCNFTPCTLLHRLVAQFLLLVPLNLAIIYLDIIQVVRISKRLFVGLGHPKYTGARSKYKSRYVSWIYSVWLLTSLVTLRHLYSALTSGHRSQHSRLADQPHLSPVVVKFAHLTCSQACWLDT